MRKSKGKQVDLFYSNLDKKQLSKKKAGMVDSRLKKKTNGKAKGLKKSDKKVTDVINLDNEIIIGITPKGQEKKNLKKNSSNRTKNKKVGVTSSCPKKEDKTNKNKAQKKSKKVKKEVDIQKRKVKLKILKWTSIVVLITIAIILFILSSVFNIRDIKVNNNSKISNEEIISLSGIKKDENMFKLNMWEIEENIKREPYIANVDIKRNLNGTINIDIEERKATYMLAFANSYVYVNNQGYMLEISEEKLLVPMLTGFETEAKDIEAGKRLTESDLLKLGTVIKIMDSARGNNIANAITSIDISDDQNYILKLDTEGKIIYFGDSSKINQKVIWIMGCVEQEKGISGELFLKNVNKPYFREKVKF